MGCRFATGYGPWDCYKVEGSTDSVRDLKEATKVSHINILSRLSGPGSSQVHGLRLKDPSEEALLIKKKAVVEGKEVNWQGLMDKKYSKGVDVDVDVDGDYVDKENNDYGDSVGVGVDGDNEDGVGLNGDYGDGVGLGGDYEDGVGVCSDYGDITKKCMDLF
ncbi:hypothetical protein LWI28_008542 [Acer negundo]|uniref:Uncharacterized protein n=1 Tax=Acer negundo TaxID=4023 RepID=A0AAD5I667_ACENE|nr:hypothetical protein LWI28_008542 [Acer negundo]